MLSKKDITILNATEKNIKRFWCDVDKGKGTLKECWEWLGYKTPKGYGTFGINNDSVRSHRFSFFLHTGILNENLCVCHLCDNPGCVNPNHLWLGTLQANNFDKMLKGREPKGSTHFNAILNEKKVKEILIRLHNGESNVAIAKDYPVTKATISDIKTGRAWTHVALS